MACQLLETLATQCKPGVRNEESECPVEALDEVVQFIKQCAADEEIHALALKTVMSLSRYPDHRLFNPERQLLLRNSGVIPVLMDSLKSLIQLNKRPMIDPERSKSAKLALANTVQALNYTCFSNKDNLLILASLQGFQTIKMIIEDHSNDSAVHEHGCIIISDLASTVESSPENIEDCITTINKIIRLQIHDQHLDTTRAAVWSLHRLVNCLLSSSKLHNFSESVGADLLRGESMDLVLDTIQDCLLKNDLLVKHCLDFIAFVTGSNGIAPYTTSNSENMNNTHRAFDTVYELFLGTADLGIKAVSLRTLYCLVTNMNVFVKKEEEETLFQLDTFFDCLKFAKKVPQTSKTDIFLIQVFVLNIISAVIDDLSNSGVILKSGQISQHNQSLLTTIGYIVRYIGEDSEDLYIQLSNEETITKAKLTTDQIYYDYNCGNLQHKPCEKAQVLKSLLTAMELLALSGNDTLNQVDDEGFGVIHQLAAAGLDQFLTKVVEFFGSDLDLTKETKDGKTALQLAVEYNHPNCISVLKSATELATNREKTNTAWISIQNEDAVAIQEQQFNSGKQESTKHVSSLSFPSKENFIVTEPNQSSGPFSVKTQNAKAGDLDGVKVELIKNPDQLERHKRLEELDEDSLLKISTPTKPETVFRNSLIQSRLILYKDTSPLLKSSSTEECTYSEIPEPPQLTALGHSLSVGSRCNNYSSETTTACAPTAGSTEDRQFIDWQNLEESQVNLKEKLSMVSSSSGQNNHFTPDQSMEAVDKNLHPLWPRLGQLQPTKNTVNDGDLPDEHQILSWMSSEIYGLITSGPEETEASKKSTMSEMADQFHPFLTQPVSFESLEEKISASFLAMDPTLSPFYSARPNATATGSHQMQPFMALQSPDATQQNQMSFTEDNETPSKHLWLGNLNTRLPRSVLKSIFEEYGPIEDVVTFPGRMYAFVNFIHPVDAQRAAKELDNLNLPVLTGSRKLVIKFRPNRKALGRVGDLMPGVVHVEAGHEGVMPPSISGPVLNTSEAVVEESPEPDPSGGTSSTSVLPPSRHLWLGNVCLRPSKIVLFSLFSRYGPVQSVRVFPGKTFAFVNFCSKEHSTKAKEALDQKVIELVTGNKPLVIRFQKEGAGQGAWTRANPENICTCLPSPPPPPPIKETEGISCSTAMEASSIGHLTRTLSAAVHGMRLPSSFSGGSDGRGYFSPFRTPISPEMHHQRTPEQMGVELRNLNEQTNTSGVQNYAASSSVVNMGGGVHASLPEDILFTNQGQPSGMATEHQIILPRMKSANTSLFSHHGGSIW
eukprot:g4520.t1